LVFLLSVHLVAVDTPARAAEQRGPKWLSNGIKTTRVVLNGAAGVLTGFAVQHGAAKLGVQLDPTHAHMLMGLASYVGNEVCKAVTGKVVGRFLSRYEHPSSTVPPVRPTHKIVGALSAALSGSLLGVSGQWVGKYVAAALSDKFPARRKIAPTPKPPASSTIVAVGLAPNLEGAKEHLTKLQRRSQTLFEELRLHVEHHWASWDGEPLSHEVVEANGLLRQAVRKQWFQRGSSCPISAREHIQDGYSRLHRLFRSLAAD
jgi:hypothetical protein